MTRCDSDYYERRAEQELELAEHATKPKVVAGTTDWPNSTLSGYRPNPKLRRMTINGLVTVLLP